MPDSRLDTYEHIGEVRRLLLQMATDLMRRADEHDRSKLVEPELSMFDVYRQKLDEVEHDSPEYRQHLVDMGEALEHHYRENRHHPEHFDAGIDGMTLLDLVEMLCDWIAAARRQNGDVSDWIANGGQERFGYGDQLKRILLNTVNGPVRSL